MPDLSEIFAQFYSLPTTAREKVVVDFITTYPCEAQLVIQQRKEALTKLRGQTSKAAYYSKMEGFSLTLENDVPATLYRLDNEKVREAAAKVKDHISENRLRYYYTITVNIEGNEVIFILACGLSEIVEYCQKMETLRHSIQWVVFNATIYHSYIPAGQLLIDAVAKKMNPNVLAVIRTEQQTSKTV
jgi:hypothetical protein